MGDLYGVTLGDIAMDGNQELLMSRGGGSGHNARNSKIYRAGIDRSFTELKEQNKPFAMMRGRTLILIDADKILDIILYGQGKVMAYQRAGDLTYEDVSNELLTSDIKHVTGMI